MGSQSFDAIGDLPDIKPQSDLVVGSYRIGEQIASGGMAQVFRGHSVGGHRRMVAIKRMHRHLSSDRVFRSMFVREARLCSHLEHPGIVELVDFEAREDDLFLVFELVDGPDLRHVLKMCSLIKQRLPPKLCALIAAHLLESLDYAHTLTANDRPLGIIHCDLSPSNVLLTWRGRVRLADFGVARVSISGLEGVDRDLVTGKLGYMSPEQVRGESLDPRSDLFSVGVILVEMLTCRRLFHADSREQLAKMVEGADLSRLDFFSKDLPPGLLEIARRALGRSPDGRYATAAEFRDELTGWLDVVRARTGSHELAEFLTNLRST